MSYNNCKNIDIPSNPIKKLTQFGVVIIASVFALSVFSCDKEVTVQVYPEPSNGKIIINSAPESALIFVNGKNTGRYTPDSLTYFEDGNYNITLKKKYFRDTSIVVSIQNEAAVNVFIDYYSNPSMFGGLSLNSNPPGATIVLNDSVLNISTPAVINGLFPGEYTVTLKLVNYRDALLNSVVQSGINGNYFATLRDTSVWVDYQMTNSKIPSNMLKCITIDNQNIKWIGSSDKGLIKYDEIEFTSFNVSNSGIPGNNVNCISVSPDNRLWVGTTNGIGIFNGSSWIIYNQSNSPLESNIINSINFDNSGITWIGTSTGLFKFDGVNWQRYYNSKIGLWVNDIEFAPDKIWIASDETGIISLADDSLTYYPDSIFNYPSPRISSSAIENTGRVWFCHQPDSRLVSGVSYFNGTNFNSILFSSSNVAVNHITIDNFSNKWISTFDGLYRLNINNASNLYSTINSLISSNRVTSSIFDMNGVIWLTTSGGGLNKLKSY